MKKIVIAGGTGFLGSILSEYMRASFNVVILTRGASRTHKGITHVHWDGRSHGPWAAHLEGAAAIINLSGKSVDCRYTQPNKQEIYSSRLDSTRCIGEAIHRSDSPPALWINAASATIYRHSTDRPMDEYSGEIGRGFSVDVCERWEEVFNHFQLPRTRKVLIRTGIVLGKEGGPYLPLRRLAMFGLGGRQGAGNQYVSWLHAQDFCRAINFLLCNERCSGTYNLTAPEPIQNSAFMHALQKSLRMPVGLPAPKWLLEAGAWLIGTETELILKSRRVVPLRLNAEGFAFTFPTVWAALKNLRAK